MNHHQHNDFRDAWNALGNAYAKALGLHAAVEWLNQAPTRWQRARRWVANLVRWR